VVSSVISLISKTGFGIFLAHLVCLKSEKSKMPENFQKSTSAFSVLLEDSLRTLSET
jgi:hypothetical protein